MNMLHESTVLIVGAGMAGLTVAYALALRGISVEVLEFGPLPDPEREFRTDLWPDQLTRRGLGKAGQEYYCPDHFTAARNAPYQLGNEVGNSWLKRTRVAGGKTLYWTGHALRFSDYEFRARTLTGAGEDWPIDYAELSRYYAQAEALIKVCGTREQLPQQPDGDFLPPFSLRAGEELLQQALAKQAIKMIPARKAILTQRPENIAGNGARAVCHQCGRCYLGCKTAAKFDAFSALYPAALATGKLKLRANSVVLELLSDRHGQLQGARYVDRLSGRAGVARARVVVLAAAAIETARLLLNSHSRHHRHGLANRNGLVGCFLTESIGIRIEALLPQLRSRPVENDDGSGEHGLIPRRLESLKDLDNGGGNFLFLTQSGAEIFPSFANRLPGFGAQLQREIRAWYPAAIRLYGIGNVASRRENRVRLDETRLDQWGAPVAKVEFSLSDEDLARWQSMSREGREFLQAVGGEYLAVVQNGPETGGGLHAAGSCRMGTDPDDSVVNSFGQSHEIKNLFVADAAVFVSSLNQPTLTIAALALRTAEQLAEQLRKGEL